MPRALNRKNKILSEKLLRHPARAAILLTMDGGELSPQGYAEQAKTTIAAAGYHFKVLRHVGAIRFERRERHGRDFEHFFTLAPDVVIDVA